MVFDPLAAVAAFSVLATVVVGLFAFYGNAVPASNVRGRLEGLMSGTMAVDPVQSSAALRAPKTDTGMLAKVASANLSEKLTRQLERADMTLSPGEYIVIRLALAAIGFIAPFFFIQGVIGWLIMLVAAVIGYNLPKFYMNRRHKSRLEKLNAQLPEALTMISNSLKAGFGLLQSLAASAEQLQHPISTEFGRTIHEMNIGSGVEEAMTALGERSESYDLDIVITAILVQRTVGGNLGEILDNVADTMRERIRIRGEIETLTAQQKLTGVVIGLLPLAVGVLFTMISPGYINPLFSTVLGKVMLVAAVVLETLGIMIIQRIMDIEV